MYNSWFVLGCSMKVYIFVNVCERQWNKILLSKSSRSLWFGYDHVKDTRIKDQRNIEQEKCFSHL